MGYIEGLKLGRWKKISIERFALTFFQKEELKSVSRAKAAFALGSLRAQGKVSYDGKGIFSIL